MGNYWPIECLNLIWRLLTRIMAEKLYDHLDEQILMPDEQKNCRCRFCGTIDQLWLMRQLSSTNVNQQLINLWSLINGWSSHYTSLELLTMSYSFWKVTWPVKKLHLVPGGSRLDVGSIFVGDLLGSSLFAVALLMITLLLLNWSRDIHVGNLKGR